MRGEGKQRMIKSELIKMYYSTQAGAQVLGCLMNNPKLLNRRTVMVNIDDFVGKMHKLIFNCIYNLSVQGVKEIEIRDIEAYLSLNDSTGHKLLFDNEENLGWLYDIQQDASEDNFEYYYSIVKKMSILREFVHDDFNVKGILDMETVDSTLLQMQMEKFEQMEVDDVRKYFDTKIAKIKQKFSVKEEGSRRKSGEGSRELRERLKEVPNFGFNLECGHLNTIVRGALPKRFFLESRDSGTGKTRCAVRRLVGLCSPYLWSFEAEEFIENPNGMYNAGLYIGTEMELYEDLEPMIWAFISGVPEDKIRDNATTEEEEERVQFAIECSEKMVLHMEDQPNYSVSDLWDTIDEYYNLYANDEYYNLNAVAVDYLELTTAMTLEYSQGLRMSIREDQILLNLSSNIKNMTNEYDLTLFAFTQVSSEARLSDMRNQQVIKGGKAIVNKADVGITVFEPTEKELKLVEKTIEKLDLEYEPNIVYTVYKNRHGKIKDVKIFAYQDLGTGRVIGLFCTKGNYKPIDIEETYIDLREDELEGEE